MGKKSTKVLITERNSVWGIIQHQVAENEYPHILSWDSEEIKDEFVNVELFPKTRKATPNFNFKDYMRQADYPTKPMTILSDLKAEFRFDYENAKIITPELNLDFPKQDILNKDFAIILEIDEKGNETFTYWAITITQTNTPHIFQANCELDILFTYNVLDLFGNEDIQIKQGMLDRDFTENGKPILSVNSILTYPEEFDSQFSNIQIPITKFELYDKQFKYIFLADDEYTWKKYIGTGSREVDIYLTYTVNPINEKYTYPPENPATLLDITINDTTYQKDLLELKNKPKAYNGVIDTFIEFERVSSGNRGWNFKVETDYSGGGTIYETQLNTCYNYGKKDFISDDIIKIDISKLKDKNAPYDYKLETKIYKAPYTYTEIYDLNYENFIIPLEKMDSTFKLEFLQVATPTGVSIIVRPISTFYGEKYTNIPFMKEINANLFSPQILNNWEQFQVYNKAQFENATSNAKRHELQNKVEGSLGIIKGIVDLPASASKGLAGDFGGAAQGIVGGVQGIAKGGIQIANAKEELNGLLAQQQDLQNQPPQIKNATTTYYQLQNKYFKEIVSLYLMQASDIVMQKLAWLFHIGGVNYAGTPTNINKVMNNNYYYNYIKTGQSVFSQFKKDLSAPIKQLIDSILQQGTTIWHIRSIEDFKGIANYNVNNVEMKYLNG